MHSYQSTSVYANGLCLCFLSVIVLFTATGTSAQTPAKAAGYSILLPGLGHRYANENTWNRRAALYTITDAVLMIGLISSEWHHRYLANSYQTWAVSYAGITPAGKDRRYYVTIGNYLSSDVYRDVQLRNRRVDQAAYVNDPAFHWTWHSIQDLQRYRNLRKSSESWAQRRGSIVAALVANRLVSAVSSLLTARRKQSSALQVRVAPGPHVQLALTL